MHEERFFKKKQLLVQRDRLLEEIGQSVFETAIPTEFANLPKEFRAMDIVLRKLKERARLFREDRDRATLDLREVQDEMARVEKEFKRESEPLRKECDAMALKLSYQHDQALNKNAAPAEESLPERYEDSRCELAALQKAHRLNWTALLEKADPLERHIYRLETAIFEVQEEMAGLGSSRAMRLRDLGSSFHRHNPNEPQYLEKFKQLKQLRQSLIEFKQTDHQTRNESQDEPRKLVRKRETYQWRWPIALLLIFALVGYTFRTEYREDDLSFAWIADQFLAKEAGYRVFGDFAQMPVPALKEIMPDFEKIPGGETIFRAMRTEDIAQVLEGRVEPGQDLLYFGVRFRRPPARFGLRLNSAGWRNQSAILDRRVLAKDDWIWLIINDRSFFLMRQQDQKAFIAHAKGDHKSALYLASTMPAIGNARPLLQGYDRLQLDIQPDHFRLDFKGATPPVDLPARHALLEEMPTHAGDLLLRDITEKSFSISGPRNFLDQVPLTPQAITARVAKYLDSYLQDVPKEALTSTGIKPSSATFDRLQVFTGMDTPHLRADLTVPGQVDDMVFHQPSDSLLLLVDGKLLRYLLSERTLALKEESALRYPADEPSDFKPTHILPAPSDLFAVLLETPNHAHPKARMLLVSLATMEPLSLELLGDANNWEAASWDQKGHSFYLTYRPERTNKQSHVVAVYRLENERLMLTHLVDLGTGTAPVLLPDLTMHPTQPTLYFTSWPSEQLLRCEPSQEGSGNTQVLDLHQRIGGRNFSPISGPGLALSRDGSYAMIAATMDVNLDATHKVVYLVELGPTRMTQLETADPNFSVSAIWRQPLSDRFWVMGEDAGLIKIFEIVQGQIRDRTLHPLNGLQPQHICSDAYGRTIFISGQVRP